jgi:hypothetical protein
MKPQHLDYITMPSKPIQTHKPVVGSKEWIDDYCASLLLRIVNLELLNKHYPEVRTATKPKIKEYWQEWQEWKIKYHNQFL